MASSRLASLVLPAQSAPLPRVRPDPGFRARLMRGASRADARLDAGLRVDMGGGGCLARVGNGSARDPRRVWRGVGGKGKWAWAFLPFPARPLPPAPPRAWREGADRWLAGAEGWRAGARLLPAGLHGCCRRFLWPTGCGSGLNSFGVRSLS